MKRLGVALIGAGFMGRRHLLGYAALQRAGYDRLRVEAIVDLDESVANSRADEAETLLGYRPRVYTDVHGMLSAEDAVDAVDIVTDPRTHHTIAIAAMEAGRDVMCEKPLALTIRTGAMMVAAAERTGRVLATGENYRRGGSNRLAKAVIDSGVLGELFLFRELRVGGDDGVIISPWRHMKRSGSIGLDMPIHYADIIEYLLGPVDQVWGRGFIAEPQRYPCRRRRADRRGRRRLAGGGDDHGRRGGRAPRVHPLGTRRALRSSECCTAGPARSRSRPTAQTATSCCIWPTARARALAVAEFLGSRFELDPVTVAVHGPGRHRRQGSPLGGCRCRPPRDRTRRLRRRRARRTRARGRRPRRPPRARRRPRRLRVGNPRTRRLGRRGPLGSRPLPTRTTSTPSSRRWRNDARQALPPGRVRRPRPRRGRPALGRRARSRSVERVDPDPRRPQRHRLRRRAGDLQLPSRPRVVGAAPVRAGAAARRVPASSRISSRHPARGSTTSACSRTIMPRHPPRSSRAGTSPSRARASARARTAGSPTSASPAGDAIVELIHPPTERFVPDYIYPAPEA